MVRGASHASINLSTELTRLRECVRLSISLHTRLKGREELDEGETYKKYSKT